jgi:uncharacterized protein
MTPVVKLQALLKTYGRVLLGYSGGVDSSLLAVAATTALGPERFLAVIGRSASYPESQYRIATDIACRFSIPLLEVATDELTDPEYRANATTRCFFCKRELWGQLGRLADERGYDTVIDGTNGDDLQEHRPGARAGDSAGVRSPLAELGWDKAMVRHAARLLGLPIWDAPAAPCLASRIRYGVEVTEERLGQVEEAESYLRTLGVTGDLRVRHSGLDASVEVGLEALPLVRRHWPEVVDTLQRLGFQAVNLDQDGYRRGKLLTVIES